eukprot:CAMPEP_0180649866 /NCGR_PEP_ID=MMETSP1037_2-20121125/51862_1 /TAXON_ID=632150 /ORGANISM="Azadinium spinosum, Strain 3D9" /LENGTH=197 /DNA_ID=CAMNT_0022675041 /DNA_START=228 /DNA_END=818 /DNA_ORIENTATION=+
MTLPHIISQAEYFKMVSMSPVMTGRRYVAIFIMRDPWSRYQSDYSYRAVRETQRKDLYVASNESQLSFYDRYQNYVVSHMGDFISYRRCMVHARAGEYVIPCFVGEARLRGDAIVEHLISGLHRNYMAVGLTERMQESLIMFRHAYIDPCKTWPHGKKRVANAHPHKAVPITNETLALYSPYIALDMKLYHAVQALF